MTAFNDTFGIIGFSSENVGIDRRIYTGLTSTNPQLNVSYNGGRVDVYLNGVKLMGNHSGQSNYDYTYQNTGSGSAITLSTGVALVATDTIECVGYVSNSSNTVTTYTPSVSAGNNTFTSISHTSSDLLNVFLNGVLLDPSDYTADASADTVAITSLASGDVVHIQVIGALDHSDFVPAGGGTFSGDVSFGDNNITNVGDIAVDTISSDAGTSIGVTLGTDAGDDFNVGSGKLVVEGDTGNVGIGTDGPAGDLHITESGASEVRLQLTNSNTGHTASDGFAIVLDAGATNQYFWNYEARNMVFGTSGSTKMTIDSNGNITTGTTNNERIIIGSAGGGIDFSNCTGNSGAEVLDDYEEGSITSVTISGSTSGSGSVACSGSYTKVGRLVTVTVNIANQTFPTFSGQLQCSLPFTVDSVLAHGPDTYYFPQSNWDQHTNWVGFKAQASAGQSFCVFPYIVLDSDRQSVLTSANTIVSGTSGLYLTFSITYQSA